MKKKSFNHMDWEIIFTVAILLILAVSAGCVTSESRTAEHSSATEPAARIAMLQPMAIPQDVSCGKCGMYPANYPQWQSQIIFKDGSMTPFDGCKCMFNFMNAINQYDTSHSIDDVGAVFVKDFNTGEWLNASEAHFVVGSNVMGPMGKELIPFADQAAAMKFNQEQGGTMMKYADISPDVLKTLGMGGMKMEQGSKHMKM